MYAKNVTVQNLKDIAAEFNFEVDADDEGYRVRFRLQNRSDKFHCISRNLWGSDRKYRTKVCFHGHWVFLRKLFTEYPDAIVDAGWYKRVRYTAENFEDLAAEVGNTVIREWDQLTPKDKCDCNEQKMFIMMCPHLIMVPEHYRHNGFCRCWDKTHTEMKDWGYEWKDGQWR